MITITYFVHGTTTDNEKDLATGWSPGRLSALGIKQSKLLAGQTNHLKFDVVFCSDLKRAVDSANLTWKGKYKIVKDARLREAHYGAFTRKPSDTFKNDMEKYISKKFPQGESYKDVEKRMHSFLTFLKKNYKGKHVAIVAHQGPQLALDVIVKKKTWKEAMAEDWRRVGKWQPGWTYRI